MLNNPASDVALLRIINTPPRTIGKTTVKRLAQHARQHRLSLFDAARQAGLVESLPKRSAVHVAKFVAMMDQMHLVGGETVAEAIGKILSVTGYREWLAEGGTEEDLQRVDNLDELLSDAREFDESHEDDGGVEAFLEQASLVADIDDWEIESDCVTMMTLHAAKGLEFPVVYIVAVEDDVLPHARCKEYPDQLEEERRLLFVGITRAREELHISAAQERTTRGKINYVAPSPFLLEVERDDMEIVGQLTGFGHDYSQLAEHDDWDQDDWDDELWDEEEGPLEDDLELDDASQPRAVRRIQRPKRSQRPVPSDSSNSTRSIGTPFVTAADMAGLSDAPTEVRPESFRDGMVVMHPEYGLGKIVALGGSGSKRSATVQFAGGEQARTFRLAYSELRPVGS